jgi:hypothetical protein
MNTVANFVKERNEALFSLDRKKIEAYCAKYGDSDSANVPDVVFWAGVYKAICEIKNAPEEKCRSLVPGSKHMGFLLLSHNG